MKERFEGKEGKRLLIEALRGQTVAEGRQDIAEQLADLAQLKEFAAGDEIMRQDAEDNHVSLIVSGSVSIVVHGHEVNRRIAGQHVGDCEGRH